MNKNDKSSKSIIIFICILLGLTIGGYFIIKNNNNENITDSISSNYKRASKKDYDKNYIYYINEEEISEELQLTFKDIVLNIESDDAIKVEEKLNNEMQEVRKALVKQSEKDYVEQDTLEENGNDDDIYSVNMIDYEVMESNKYLSLVVSNYSYNVIDGISDKVYSYYIFDLSNGNLLNNQDILKKEHITDQQVRKRIREYINDDENVDIDLTLNNPYYLTIAKNGNVILNFIVNSNDITYNVSIEMD